MGMKDKATAFGRKFKLDSHHAIERFGIFAGVFALTGTVVLGGSGAAAIQANNEAVSQTALYNTSFTTSKTDLKGSVEGVYVNELGDRVLVMMSFAARAPISYSASDYQAFLLGSDTNLNSNPVQTDGVTGTFYVFGSTGYVGVLLDAEEPFAKQVLNLTMRANAELAYTEPDPNASVDDLAGDATFKKYDQWRVFINPGASEAEVIPALDDLNFDPARAYYDIVLKAEEDEARGKLDAKLLEMRTDQAQIASYNGDLATTKVDNLFLRPPTIPESIASDEIVGASASETDDQVSTLELETGTVVPGGFDFDWREGNIYDGYLRDLVPAGESYATYLASKREETGAGLTSEISSIPWLLSDGTDLARDYRSSEVTMRPLMNVMNNLSQSYLSYAKHKGEYQSNLLLDLLRLDVELRDVQSNSTVRDDEGFLVALY